MHEQERRTVRRQVTGGQARPCHQGDDVPEEARAAHMLSFNDLTGSFHFGIGMGLHSCGFLQLLS